MAEIVQFRDEREINQKVFLIKLTCAYSAKNHVQQQKHSNDLTATSELVAQVNCRSVESVKEHFETQKTCDKRRNPVKMQKTSNKRRRLFVNVKNKHRQFCDLFIYCERVMIVENKRCYRNHIVGVSNLERTFKFSYFLKNLSLSFSNVCD